MENTSTTFKKGFGSITMIQGGYMQKADTLEGTKFLLILQKEEIQ
jgi:hypothetical protein